MIGILRRLGGGGCLFEGWGWKGREGAGCGDDGLLGVMRERDGAWSRAGLHSGVGNSPVFDSLEYIRCKIHSSRLSCIRYMRSRWSP